MTSISATIFSLLWPVAGVSFQRDASDIQRVAKSYSDAIRKVNEDHARRPGKAAEPDLKNRIPAAAKKALEVLLQRKDSPALFEGLILCGQAALDLDVIEDFARIKERIEKSSPEHSRKLGAALSRPRFVLIGLGGLDSAYLESFAEVLEAVLQSYDDIFGFKEWSKVPGKKLRVRVSLEDKSPHFAPQLPFHSEVDFPVSDGTAFKSPTSDGKFLFYGLCHEMGHVIAMWGDGNVEEDHHAWAHYTGVAIVEHLSKAAADKPWHKRLSDVRWRSLEAERKQLEGTSPSLKDKDGVLRLLILLHDKVGSKAIGAAINHLDALDKRLRINKVRYYTFKELETGLLATLKDASAKKTAASILAQAGKER